METQKFNLCWNEFDKAASLTLKCLVEDQDFTDVTISCDDQQMQVFKGVFWILIESRFTIFVMFKAHKIVLASSSSVFRWMLKLIVSSLIGHSALTSRRMLLKNAHPNPLIHLRGVNKTTLKCVIEFMYLGQTEVIISTSWTKSRLISYQVDQNQLPVFMSVAKDLEIRCLEAALSGNFIFLQFTEGCQRTSAAWASQ